MSAALWMNIPLMVLAFALMTGIPLWLVIRRADWHGRPEARAVPVYLTRHAAPVRAGQVRVPRSAEYAGYRAL
jgi:hypothetical protein